MLGDFCGSSVSTPSTVMILGKYRFLGRGNTRVVFAVQIAFPSGTAYRSVVLVDYQTVVVVLVVAQTLWGCFRVSTPSLTACRMGVGHTLGTVDCWI